MSHTYLHISIYIEFDLEYGHYIAIRTSYIIKKIHETLLIRIHDKKLLQKHDLLQQSKNLKKFEFQISARLKRASYTPLESIIKPNFLLSVTPSLPLESF